MSEFCELCHSSNDIGFFLSIPVCPECLSFCRGINRLIRPEEYLKVVTFIVLMLQSKKSRSPF